MNIEKIINELSQKYKCKTIIKNKKENPTEIICEIKPGLAIAVIDKSESYYHKIITETYKVLDGELNVFINNIKHKLKKGDVVSIEPNNIHYAIGNETWVEVYSKPAWTSKGHFLI